MATILNQAVGDIIENYADVIEGGNSYRGSGTVYRGIPGNYPNDSNLRDGTDTPLTVVGTTVSTTTFDVTGHSWEQARWVKTQSPGFWALCNTAGSNFGQARKITGYNNTTKVFTVAPAFSAAPSANDSMVILQGFKRIPNSIDIEDDHVKLVDGYDRRFHLKMGPGKPTAYSGTGARTYRTELQLRLRLTKKDRVHDTEASLLDNLAALSSPIETGANPDHRDGTYTRAIWVEEEPETLKDDQYKIVVSQKFVLVYRISTELL
jgi:hypothetical protein